MSLVMDPIQKLTFWQSYMGEIGVAIAIIATVGAGLLNFLKSAGDRAAGSVHPSSAHKYYWRYAIGLLLCAALTAFGSYCSRHANDAQNEYQVKQSRDRDQEQKNQIRDLKDEIHRIRVDQNTAKRSDSEQIAAENHKLIQDGFKELVARELKGSNESEGMFLQVMKAAEEDKKLRYDKALQLEQLRTEQSITPFKLTLELARDFLMEFEKSKHIPVNIPSEFKFPPNLYSEKTAFRVIIGTNAIWDVEMSASADSFTDKPSPSIDAPKLNFYFDRARGHSIIERIATLSIYLDRDPNKITIDYSGILPFPKSEDINGTIDVADFNVAIQRVIRQLFLPLCYDAEIPHAPNL